MNKMGVGYKTQRDHCHRRSLVNFLLLCLRATSRKDPLNKKAGCRMAFMGWL